MSNGELKEEKNLQKLDYILNLARAYIIEELVPTSLKIQFYKANVLERQCSLAWPLVE